MIKHIIFEMDGVVANSAKAILPACAQTSKKFGLPPISDEIVCQTIGCASPEFYFRLYPHKTKHMMLEYAREADALTEALSWEAGPRILFPGVLSMLESLMLRRIALYVLCARDFSYANAVLTTAGIQHFFNIIAFNADQENMVQNMVYGNPARWALIGSTTDGLYAARTNSIFSMAAGFGYINKKNAAMYGRVLKTPGSILSFIR